MSSSTTTTSLIAPQSLTVLLDKLKTRYSGKTLLGAIALFLFTVAYSTRQRKKSRGQLIRDLSAVGSTTGKRDAWNEFDVIVVGGGTSGCALAARLSENPTIKVLLLEAGGSGCAVPESRMPAGFGRLFRSKHSFELYTEPQEFAKGKAKFWPRGKMLGGCSAINAQMAQYGSPEDFDEWAAHIQDDSWAWTNFSKYFRKFEKYTPDNRYPQVDTSVRGTQGPIRVGYFNTVSNSAQAFIDACIRVGIRYTPDFNGPKGPLGVSRMMTYVDDKYRRVSSESAYLTPEVLARPNLKVAIHAYVTRILFENVDGEARAAGVEYANSQSGPRYCSWARKDVVLSAGAVHSPHLLLVSGVGPAEQLKTHGIPVVKDLPGVGANLVDHPAIDVSFKDKQNASAKFLQPKSLKDVLNVLRAVWQYRLGFGGHLAMNFGESAAFVRSDDPVLFPTSTEEFSKTLLDSTSSKNSPDLEIFTTPFAYKDHGAVGFDVHTRALHVYLLRPTSQGSITLKSSNPFDFPVIDPKYLQTPEDVEKLVRGVKLCLRIAQAEPLEPYMEHTFLRPDLDHALHQKSDEELRNVVRERVETVYHPTSTCRMAPPEQNGVVDSNLRVYGIKRLRVCDASFFPWNISGHPAGAIFAAAEKLADEMKAEA